MSSEVSSMAVMMRSISSIMSTFFDSGLLEPTFFLDEDFSRETFLFCDASIVVRESFGGVTSHFSCLSHYFPPSSWFNSSSPPLADESGLLSSDVLSSSSVYVLDFVLFLLLLCDSLSIILSLGDQRTSDDVRVGEFYIFDRNNEFGWQFFGYLLHIFIGLFIIILHLLLTFIPT
jgi:hypothetical protein